MKLRLASFFMEKAAKKGVFGDTQIISFFVLLQREKNTKRKKYATEGTEGNMRFRLINSDWSVFWNGNKMPTDTDVRCKAG